MFLLQKKLTLLFGIILFAICAFEEHFKRYLKNDRRPAIVWVLKRLDTIPIKVNNGFLNCLDYLAAIERLLKLLASSTNTPDVKRCYALNLPDSQWVVRRLNLLHDALTDLKKWRKLIFSDLNTIYVRFYRRQSV